MSKDAKNVQSGKGTADGLEPEAKRRKVGGKRKVSHSPEEFEIRQRIVTATKSQDLAAAFLAYDEAKQKGLKLKADTLNILLFLCAGGDDWQEEFQHLPIPWALARLEEQSTPAKSTGAQEAENSTEAPSTPEGPKVKVSLSERQARANQILKELREVSTNGLSEMTYTGLARLAAAVKDADGAFEVAKEGQQAGVPTRLRTFLPSLLAYTVQGNIQGALKVAETLKAAEVDLTETEHAVLLLACQHTSDTQIAESVLKQIGAELTHLHPKTIAAAETYFRSEHAQKSLKEGQSWKVERCTVDSKGNPSTSSGTLQVVDLEDKEWKEFEAGVTKLAVQKERNPNDFKKFQEWLEEKGPFTKIIDGANIAFFGQNYDAGDFRFSQIGDVVETILESNPDEKPLVVLHKKRTKDAPAHKDEAISLLKNLNEEGLIYPTPYGSNDDWYWIYATVKAGRNGLIVSNDEMRDHIFQMLAPKFFLKWKENHQMKYKFTGEGLELFKPPKYTACTQKLSDGSWLLPIANSEEWLCAKPVTE